MIFFFFFFKQKTAYEMRISDWSSDVCSSDLGFTDWADAHARQGMGALQGQRELRSVRLYRDAAHRGDRGRAEVDRGGGPGDQRWRSAPTPRHLQEPHSPGQGRRSEERRGGKGWVSTCRHRGRPYHEKQKE